MSPTSPAPKPVHRLVACDTIWRAFNEVQPFHTDAEYREMVDAVSRLLAAGRLVILTRRGNQMEVCSRP